MKLLVAAARKAQVSPAEWIRQQLFVTETITYLREATHDHEQTH
jgi:hypothetical protein